MDVRYEWFFEDIFKEAQRSEQGVFARLFGLFKSITE
jgi:hypothetical protein